jgi:predicted dehydrogenase
MLKVLVIGLGQMGQSHALAHHGLESSQIVGLVNRSPREMPQVLQDYPLLNTIEEGLALKPDLVVIATYSDSHADLAIRAMEAGAHVFVEKPLATTVSDAQKVVDTAQRLGRKLVVGYILRHHPSWTSMIAEARALGRPLCLPHEPQPAIHRRTNGTSTAR